MCAIFRNLLQWAPQRDILLINKSKHTHICWRLYICIYVSMYVYMYIFKFSEICAFFELNKIKIFANVFCSFCKYDIFTARIYETLSLMKSLLLQFKKNRFCQKRKNNTIWSIRCCLFLFNIRFILKYIWSRKIKKIKKSQIYLKYIIKYKCSSNGRRNIFGQFIQFWNDLINLKQLNKFKKYDLHINKKLITIIIISEIIPYFFVFIKHVL